LLMIPLVFKSVYDCHVHVFCALEPNVRTRTKYVLEHIEGDHRHSLCE
jgi:hypothetical protein